MKRVDPNYQSKPSQRMVQPTAMATPAYQYGVEQVDGNDAWTLMCACADGDLVTVRKMLDSDVCLANAQFWYQFPIHMAVREGHVDVVKPEHSAPNGAALFEACAGAHVETVELLLNHGANPNAETDSSGHCLTIVDHKNPNNFKQVQALLRKHGAKNPPLNMSRGELTQALRKSNPIIHARGRFGTDYGSFLYAVLREDDTELLSLYIENVGDAAIKQRSATDLFSKCESVIDLLVKHGLEVNRADWLGRTCLHGCATEPTPQAAAAYLKHGADLNAIDLEYSETPLGTAARCGKLEMVNFLLDQGANPNLPEDRLWARPLAYAQSKGHSDVATVLREHGATA